MKENAKPYFSVEQFSQLTGISPATVWRYIRAGKLARLQLGGPRTRVLIPASALEQLEVFKNSVAATGTLSALGPADQDDSPRLSGPRPRWTRKRKKNQEY